jgi:hypothetical protein
MKKEPANPSPLKPLIGLHQGKLTIFVSAFPISPLEPRHYRDSPPQIDSANPMKTLTHLEKYFS